MLSIVGTDTWRRAHPGAIIGLLELSGVDNASASELLEPHKREIEARLAAHYGEMTRQELRAQAVLSAYASYYKRFKKTYHVQLQVESIAHKGKRLPSVSPLVDANFMAEVETWVLTAGHDVDQLSEPVVIDVSREGERMRQMDGSEREIYAGDMVMRDPEGIRCSILYGQDDRSLIAPATNQALYVAYAPQGVPAEAVEAQLGRIEAYVRLFAPGAVREQCRLLRA
jgi:DNA/RNA-binding domain of Phe-tRNA-synthetase-like protein